MEKPRGIDVTDDRDPKVPMKERWANYQPNKKSIYKAVGFSVLATVALGFTVGGWHTTSGAQEVAQNARVEYAAQLCADRFMAADITGQSLANLKKVNGRVQRGNILARGDWVAAPAGASEEFVTQVRGACAERLVTGGAGSGTMAGGKTA
jgi:roadblock/LC7 domain-containing protein